MGEETENSRGNGQGQGDGREEGNWNGWDDNEMRGPILQKRKRTIRQGDSPRTLNIHLLAPTWAYVGEGAVQGGRLS